MALDITCDYYFEVTSASGSNGMAAQETGFALAFDLALLGSGHGFWTHVKTDGGDIRAAKSDGTTQLALHVVEIDTTGKKGLLRFNDTSPTAATTWRIYYGNASASQPAADSTYGSQNAYGGTACRLALPMAGTPADYSAPQDSQTPTVTDTGTDAETSVVKIGKSCRRFVRVNGDNLKVATSGDAELTKLDFSGTTAWTALGLFYSDSVATGSEHRTLWGKGDNQYHIENTVDGTPKLSFVTKEGTSWRESKSGTISATTWYSWAARRTSGNAYIYLDATVGGTGSNASVANSSQKNYVGDNSEYLGSREFDGRQQMLEVYAGDKGANFITSWHRMMTANTSFWPTVGAEQTTTTTQTISPSGISGAENFGTPKTTLGVVASGIASAFASGTAMLHIFTLVAGIAGAEAIGSPSVGQQVRTTGIAGAEAFGTANLGLGVVPSGISSAQAIGSPALKLYALPTGIPGAEAVGSPSVAFRIAPSGISSGEAIGGALLGLYLSPGGLAGGEAFGAPTLHLFVLPGGISGAEAVGTPSVALVSTLSPSGIPSGEGFGTASLQIFAQPSGIGGVEAFGDARVVLFAQPSGIATGAAVGDPVVGFGISPAGIPGAEGFGDFVTAFRIYPAGINSGEVFGTLRAVLFALPSGIASGQAVGSPSAGFGVAPGGIPGAGALGSPGVGFGVAPGGIPGAEGFGVLSIAISIVPTGIPGAEGFGEPSVIPLIAPAGLAGAEAFGDFRTSFRIFPDGLVAGEDFGRPTIWKPGSIYVPAIPSREAFGTPRLAATQFVLLSGIPSAQAVGSVVVVQIARSAFFDIVENDFEVGIFNTDEFAETVRYVYKNGTEISLRAIFDNEYIQILPEGGAAVQSNHPQIWVQAAKLPTKPGAEDRINIRGCWFRVITFEPDGTGLAQIVLHRERTV